ncbi:arginine--tRNA ligase [Hamadaea tsunoensis]|uniref:arginine--tRNA ligase n=1 Tax=Hamadaea tsunoensis TaxID=53368 RepID=UPI0004192ADC|nr:arginine--tRNA ligase [Hamadaea tsunoensis]
MIKILAARFAAAFSAVAGHPFDPAVRVSQFSDFQANGALALARQLGRPPREVAAAVVAHLDLAGIADEVSVAGPGYINVNMAAGFLAASAAALLGDARLGVQERAGERVVVDYSGPNVAKELHVGHLRSTVIGDATARTLEWLGHDVVRANHLGDWGTPFGLLIEHLLDLGETAAAHDLSVGDLDAFYVAARAKFDADPAFADRARSRVVALQSGDPETLRLWRLLVAESERSFLAVYATLGVTLSPADFQGESFYNPMLAPLVSELDGLGLLRPSEGAQCVFPQGFSIPLIVRKRDGGFGYPATDLAAIRYRTQELKADRLVYVVGSPQHQHFEMVFQTAREAGWLAEPARAEHIGFGQILGADGRKLASRSGDTVKLAALLTEAVDRAARIVAAKNPELDPAEQAAVAYAVGVGAVKYADLAGDRIKDYVFDWDRMLSTTGDTAAYLQYTYARIQSVLRRSEESASGVSAVEGPLLLDSSAERALALALLGFADVVEEVAETLQFHKLTGYLQSVAGAFTAFYDSCPILRAPSPEVRASRLGLSRLTARVLRQGLDLVGIVTPDRM